MTTPDTIRVRVADFAVGAGAVRLESLGLGSCVAIMLWDAGTRTGALAHVLLPEPAAGRAVVLPARYAVTAVPALVSALHERHAAGPYTATLVGGAGLFGELLKVRGVRMGERNVIAARAALRAARIPVAAEDVLGSHARSVQLVTATGVVTVRTLAHGTHVL